MAMVAVAFCCFSTKTTAKETVWYKKSNAMPKRVMPHTKSKVKRNAPAQRAIPNINGNGNNNAKPLLKSFFNYQKDNVK